MVIGKPANFEHGAQQHRAGQGILSAAAIADARRAAQALEWERRTPSRPQTGVDASSGGAVWCTTFRPGSARR